MMLNDIEIQSTTTLWLLNYKSIPFGNTGLGMLNELETIRYMFWQVTSETLIRGRQRRNK